MNRIKKSNLLYLDATKKMLQGLNDKLIPGKIKRETIELTLKSFANELEQSINVNNNTNIEVVKSNKYFLFMKDFIKENCAEININVQKFFRVLEYSSLLDNREVQELFNIQVRSYFRKRFAEISSKRVPTKVAENLDKDGCEDLNKTLEQILEQESQRTKANESKLSQAWDELSELFHNIDFPAIGLEKVQLVKYGSSQNAFKTANSDIDFTLLTNCYVNERELLKFIKGYFDLFKADGIFVGEVDLLIKTSVRTPKLEFKFKGLAFDLTINNIFGILNTKLLDVYSMVDDRCRKLGILVKLWAKKQGICSGYDWLSSYGYLMLVINFLQVLPIPILPSLQRLSEMEKEKLIKLTRILEKDKKDEQTVNTTFLADLNEIKRKFKGCENNQMGLAELLILFFNWYVNLAALGRDEMVSIKEGTLIPRKEIFEINDDDYRKNPKNFALSIEDPFDDTHDLGRVIRVYNRTNWIPQDNFNDKDEDKYKEFVDKMQEAARILKKHCQLRGSSDPIKELFEN